MAKLIKAATARKRAQEVDKVTLTMGRIAYGIAQQAAKGDFTLYAMVRSEEEGDVVGILENAGYFVTYPEYEGYLATAFMQRIKRKGWFGRLLDKLSPPEPEPVQVMESDREWEQLRISWAPPVEPVVETEEFAEAF